MSCFTTMKAVTAAGEYDLTKHVNYTGGMILGVDDFTQEFAYLSGRDRWMAREALGYGTVSGLSVRIETDIDKGPRVMVEPGTAITPRGQLVCVPAAQCAYLNQWLAAAKPEELNEYLLNVGSPPTSPPDTHVRLYVVLCYRDCPVDEMPIPGEPCRDQSELMAASRIKDDFSLELRFNAPKQPEEDAVHEYSDFLRGIEITEDDPSTPLEDFLKAIRDTYVKPVDSPPTLSPPVHLHIHPSDVAEYIREAFRLWTTELRTHMSKKAAGCALEPKTDGNFDDCVLLAELNVPLTFQSPNWKVLDGADVESLEDRRPFLLHLRMLQEWMLNERNDHGDLTGLKDDDHLQYLLVDPLTRALIADLDAANHKIINLRAGTAKTHALNLGQVATGDLAWESTKLRIAKLQDNPVDAPAPAEDHVLIFKGGNWVAQKPDHGNLDGLDDDDHKQYLLVHNTTRALIDHLNADGHKITNLAAGTKPTDAANVGQLQALNNAGGDLAGTYPDPEVVGLRKNPIVKDEPKHGDVLTWTKENSANVEMWTPKQPTEGSQVKPFIILPLATITRTATRTYEVWFNIDAPGNQVQVKTVLAKEHVQVFDETDAAPFLTPINSEIVRQLRNVYSVKLGIGANRNEPVYLRFNFVLGLIDLDNGQNLSKYALENSIKFAGTLDGETATVFARKPIERQP